MHSVVENAASGVPVRAVPRPPEYLFGVTGIELHDERASGTLELFDGLRNDDGSVGLGALGVLFDDVMGFAIPHHSGHGAGSVSLEIVLRLCAPIPASTAKLRVDAQPEHAGTSNGSATGTMRDAQGTLIAAGHQRGHYLPATGDPPQTFRADDDPHVEALLAEIAAEERSRIPHEFRNAIGVSERLGLSIDAAAHGATGSLQVHPHLLNSVQIMHGGISLAAVDCVAAAALRDRGSQLTVNSISLAYVRPIPEGATVRYDAEIMHLGRSLAVIDVAGYVEGRPAVIGSVRAGRL